MVLLRGFFRTRALLAIALGTLAGCSGGGSVPAPGAGPVAAPGGVSALSQARGSASAPSRTRGGVTTEGPMGFSAMKADFSKNTIADEGLVVANFAKTYGVKTIFLHVTGDDIGLLESRDPQTVKNLNAMFDVATVYVTTGDASWLASPTKVPQPVDDIVRKIAPLYPRFAGILYDIEPLPTQEQQYFQLLDTLFGGSNPYAFRTTILQTDPTWWRKPNRNGGESPSWLQEAESYPAVSATYLEMHGHSPGSQMTHDVTKTLPQLAKPYWSGADLETMQGNSYIGVTQAYLTASLTTVAAELQKRNPHFAGTAVDEWDDQYGSLLLTLPQPVTPHIPQPAGPLVPPPGQIYLGAFVAPNKSGGGPAEVAALESSIGRKLAYDLHYRGFRKPITGQDTADDAANGRVPMIAWDCATSDARVAAGYEDAQINTAAAEAAAFGQPMFMRFLWEMNLPVQRARQGCWDPATDLPDFKLSPVYYKAAYRHIHDLFVAAGATNVIWVWNESGGGPAPAEYYPGDDVVDWVGIDDYDRTNTSFLSNLGPILNSTMQYGKPIVICETGSQATYQQRYFSEIVGTLARRIRS